MASCQQQHHQHQQQQQQQQHCDCHSRYFAIVVDETCETNPHRCAQQHVEDATTWKPLVLLYPPADMAPLPQTLWPYSQSFPWSTAAGHPQYHWPVPVQPYLWPPMQQHYHLQHHSHQLTNLQQHYQMQHPQQVAPSQQQQYYPIGPFTYPQEYQPYRSQYYIQQQHQYQQLPYGVFSEASPSARHHLAPPIGCGASCCLEANQRRAVNLEALIPVDAQPTRTRQAYGMDKVWLEEFEHLFAQLLSTGVHWNLVEVESNPIILDSSNIIGYKGRYLVSVDRTQVACVSTECTESLEPSMEGDDNDGASSRANSCTGHDDDRTSLNDGTESTESNSETISGGQINADNYEEPAAGATRDTSLSEDVGSNQEDNDQELENGGGECMDRLRSSNVDEEEEVAIESDQDSGCQVSSDPGSDACADSSLIVIDSSSFAESTSQNERPKTGTKSAAANGSRKVPTRFRMFIDSAKVRFSCDACGHGWTSMKGRVVFWYELFELIDHKQPEGTGNSLIGYCAYKLFGQQCDVCKIENRFEKPMWYPEEVAKVLNNLYNKIGQVYFGFEMPAIDKQRRAGKPKTSHNSLLCQACHDGVCTDRK